MWPSRTVCKKSGGKQYHCVCEAGHKKIEQSCEGINTAVWTKVIPHKRKIERDSVD